MTILLKQPKIGVGDLVYSSTDCWVQDCDLMMVGLVLTSQVDQSEPFVKPYTVLWSNGDVQKLWAHDITEVNYYRNRVNSVTGYDLNS